MPPIDTTYHLVALATQEDGSYWGLLKKTGSGSTENSYLVRVTIAGALITNVGELDARYDGLVFQ